VRKHSGEQDFYIIFDNENMMKRTTMTIVKGVATVDAPVPEDVDVVGVRRVVDQIIQQKTPLILHNGFTDLCHLYDKFLYSLPEK
jgi:poly(A)-specific ribonuclease